MVLIRITYEKNQDLTLIYIYLREFDGITVNTIVSIRTNLIFDSNGNWLGVEVFNDRFDDEKFDIPLVKDVYLHLSKAYVEQKQEKILIKFDNNITVDHKVEVASNIDFNEVNGLQGIELILYNRNLKLDIARRFIKV